MLGDGVAELQEWMWTLSTRGGGESAGTGGALVLRNLRLTRRHPGSNTIEELGTAASPEEWFETLRRVFALPLDDSLPAAERAALWAAAQAHHESWIAAQPRGQGRPQPKL